jgi:hypothetical protein
MMHCILWPWWVKHWSWSVYWIDWQTLITSEQCSRKQRQNSQHKPNDVKQKQYELDLGTEQYQKNAVTI